jgi:hypothetical protein
MGDARGGARCLSPVRLSPAGLCSRPSPGGGLGGRFWALSALVTDDEAVSVASDTPASPLCVRGEAIFPQPWETSCGLRKSLGALSAPHGGRRSRLGAEVPGSRLGRPATLVPAGAARDSASRQRADSESVTRRSGDWVSPLPPAVR